ncbi:FHA domain-containing protein [Hyphomicrobium sulfonivorans]|uniref:FHA domain-containing protein n=1 Tax=Hyphomicrobium sulfonivorans TaxID=121290 RepID=UPI001570A735|nr:FHA domain-containing protein [Hyphomicrobium sulfonivorans]NSL71134.1 FHA domain-containing protein [Hyphomicrobium sulfonivorans]
MLRDLLYASTAAATGVVANVWSDFMNWLADSYASAPALMLVMVAIVVLPSLALAGIVLRRQHRSPDATIVISRPSRRGDAKPRAVTVRTGLASWPTQAWLEHGDKHYAIDRTLVRIGREADNDICLQEKTVHRYHAAARRTSDGSVLITDLSGQEGNGIFVNGARVSEARLKPGDAIAVGEAKLKFAAKPA